MTLNICNPQIGPIFLTQSYNILLIKIYYFPFIFAENFRMLDISTKITKDLEWRWDT